MTALLMLAAGALLGVLIGWAIAAARCATHVLTLQVENTLLQDRIATLTKERVS